MDRIIIITTSEKKEKNMEKEEKGTEKRFVIKPFVGTIICGPSSLPRPIHEFKRLPNKREMTNDEYERLKRMHNCFRNNKSFKYS